MEEAKDVGQAIPPVPVETVGQAPPPVPLETTQAAPPDLAKITIDQFMQTDLRVAEVRSAERVPKSKKLIKMSVFTGEDERTIVAGIGTKYTPEELVGRKVVIVANLQPAKLMGIESNGMVLAASLDGEPSLLSVDPSIPAGTKVR
jgi:methionyl-tRNA synthetase